MSYHESTMQPEALQPYDSNITFKIYPNTKRVPLKQKLMTSSENSTDEFARVLLSRQSIRSFSEEGVSLNALSCLLSLSFGLRAKDKSATFRTYASAGARYPIEVYVFVFKSCDIDMGIYHYNVLENCLELLKSGDYSDEIFDFYNITDNGIISKFPCLILFTATFSRTMQKYGERGYRFVMLDTGHMSQNLYLVASYLNMGAVALGGGRYSDQKLDDLLGLRVVEENAFYGFAVGHPK